MQTARTVAIRSLLRKRISKKAGTWRWVLYPASNCGGREFICRIGSCHQQGDIETFHRHNRIFQKAEQGGSYISEPHGVLDIPPVLTNCGNVPKHDCQTE